MHIFHKCTQVDERYQAAWTKLMQKVCANFHQEVAVVQRSYMSSSILWGFIMKAGFSGYSTCLTIAHSLAYQQLCFN